MLIITYFIYLLTLFSISRGKSILNLRKTEIKNTINEEKYKIDIPKPATIPSFINITSNEVDIEKVQKIEFLYYQENEKGKKICFSKIEETNCELFKIEGNQNRYINITINYSNGTYQLITIIEDDGTIDLSDKSYFLRSFKGDNNLFFFRKDLENKKAIITFDFFDEEILNLSDVQFSTPDTLTSNCTKYKSLYICECIFNINNYETYFASINYGDPLFSTHIAYTIFTFIYSMKEGITCTDNGQILSLLIESDEKVGYQFDIIVKNEEKEYNFKSETTEEGNQIVNFNLLEQFITDSIYVSLNDKNLTTIKDYKLEIYPDKFIYIDRTIVPMQKTQSIVLTYSRTLEEDEFEEVIFYKDSKNKESIKYPKTVEDHLICSINFEYTNIDEGEYKIFYYHKCKQKTDSKFTVFFGKLDVINYSSLL